MNRRSCFLFISMFTWMMNPLLTKAQQAKVFTVKVNEPKAVIQPTMWGVFFEDINFGADGGIYAELVKNRSFEFSKPLMGWKEQKKDNTTGNVLIINNG